MLDEKGNFNEETRKLVEAHFAKEIKKILGMAKNDNELRIIGSLLMSMIGNQVCDFIVKNDKST